MTVKKSDWFTETTLTGYRDLKICIQVSGQEGDFQHICELRIHHNSIKASDNKRLGDLAMIISRGNNTFDDSIFTSILYRERSILPLTKNDLIDFVVSSRTLYMKTIGEIGLCEPVASSCWSRSRLLGQKTRCPLLRYIDGSTLFNQTTRVAYWEIKGSNAKIDWW